MTWKYFVIGVLVGNLVVLTVGVFRSRFRRYRHRQFQRRIIEDRLNEVRNGRKNQDLTVDPQLLS